MVFDKTGTLTHGKPVVTRMVLFVVQSVCPQQLFTAIVGLAESNSEHPLGVAVTNFAKRVSRGMEQEMLLFLYGKHFNFLPVLWMTKTVLACSSLLPSPLSLPPLSLSP